MLAAAGSAHGQGGAGNAAPRTQAVTREEPGGAGRSRAGRLWVYVNGVYQPAVTRYRRRWAFRAYGERAQFLAREEFDGRGHVDAGGALPLWRALEVGASHTQVSRSGRAVVTGTVPHPIEAGRDRRAPEQTLALPHRQRATHVYVSWRFRPRDAPRSGPRDARRFRWRDAWSLALSAGPTYFNLRQGFVANVTAREAGGPPFSKVSLQVGAGEHARNGVGFNAGADFTVMLTPAGRMGRLGVGYFVRLTSGSIEAPSTSGARDAYNVGGVETGVGLRVLFR